MHPVRVWLEKTGNARYISHLDLNRAMMRALRRSGLPVWYTEGFNPHPFIAFATPLSLGMESLCECMDMRLTQEMPLTQVEACLRQVMPQGISVVRVTEPGMKPKEIAYAKYCLHFPNTDARALARRIDEAPSLPVTKKNKNGEKRVDLKPLLQVLSWEQQGDDCLLWILLPCGNTVNINPQLVPEALGMEQCCAPTVKKVEMYTASMEKFI